MEDKKELGEQLAAFRVAGPGVMDYFAKKMDLQQISERRIWLRKVLLPYPRWENLSNEQLDNIRVRKINRGYLAEDGSGYDFFLPEKKITQEESQFRRVRSMMPFEFLNYTGKDFDWTVYRDDITQIRELVNKYILHYERFKANGMGLYIHSGMKGSGKTMLACCLLNEISKRYVGSVKFVNILDFLEMTKKGFDREDEDIKAIYTSSLLVVDDIGVQLNKEWIDTVLYRLINERYCNRLPVIYTSNVHMDKLRIDDRIIDRIESTTYPIALPEEGIRREQRQQSKNKLLEEIKNNPTASGNWQQGNV